MLPIMHPDSCDSFMDEMLCATAASVSALPPNSRDAVNIMHALLGRPNVNVGGPDYITDLPPMMDRDTNNYADMIFIIRTALEFYGFIPLILRCVGDGQSVLMLSYLKRFFPRIYKHVLISNGHWHSYGHFMLQVHMCVCLCVFELHCFGTCVMCVLVHTAACCAFAPQLVYLCAGVQTLLFCTVPSNVPALVLQP